MLTISANAQVHDSAMNAAAMASTHESDRAQSNSVVMKPGAPVSELRRHPLPLPPSPFTQDSTPPPPTEDQTVRRRKALPDADCVKDTDFEFLGAFYAPNRVHQNDAEVVAPLDRVEEIPDERVEAMPRVGEN